MAEREIDNLTMKQYLALTRGNQAPGVVKPEIRGFSNNKKQEIDNSGMAERDKFGDEEDDLEDNLEDPEECGEDKANAIIGDIHDKLKDDWFNNTSEDEDDLERILDYLEPRSYDGFIDLDDEACNKRMCKLLGVTYIEPTLILQEKVKVTRYTISPGEIYGMVKVLGVDEIPITRDNIAVLAIRKRNLRYFLWKPSQDFTRLLRPPNDLKGLLHMLNATVIPTKGFMEKLVSTYDIEGKMVQCKADEFRAFGGESTRVEYLSFGVAQGLSLAGTHNAIKEPSRAMSTGHEIVYSVSDISDFNLVSINVGSDFFKVSL
uniref:Uncharacterized protein n=1 Tax=Tanacetum cinerariifolium TaxID=118510 RepID=A0A6L2NLB8_TANCI|nr:hypothetical protein [Tanacetum cinerariifolium]